MPAAVRTPETELRIIFRMHIFAHARGAGRMISPRHGFRPSRLLSAFCLLGGCLLGGSLFGGSAAAATGPIIVGLDGDLSRTHARAGEAIRRGMTLAIEEINAAGGVLERRLAIQVRDHAGDHERGARNLEKFAATRDLVAVVGAPHGPKLHANRKALGELKFPYFDPWTARLRQRAGTPDFEFPLVPSAADAGTYLAGQAVARGFRAPGLLLEESDRGSAIGEAMIAALAAQGLKPVAVSRFALGETDMGVALGALLDARADAILLVAEPSAAIAIVRTMAVLPANQRRPIMAHWSITGGRLYPDARDGLAKVDLTFLQTHTFAAPRRPARAAAVAKAYCRRFPPCRSGTDIAVPMGTAHAYDVVHILVRAIERAGTTDRDKVRAALEQVQVFEGLVRIYAPAFAPGRRTALGIGDLRLARFGKRGVPVPERRLGPPALQLGDRGGAPASRPHR